MSGEVVVAVERAIGQVVVQLRSSRAWSAVLLVAWPRSGSDGSLMD